MRRSIPERYGAIIRRTCVSWGVSLALAGVAAGPVSVASGADQGNGAETGDSSDERADGLETVTVTSRKFAESAQDVALSISALSGRDLEGIGAEGFREWANYVPNLTMFQGDGVNRRAGPTAVIRGIAQVGAGQLHELSSQATTTYTLGQLPINAGDTGLFDLNRIEVLRGPQGTLFGIASMGGTIRYIPNDAATDRFAAKISVGAGAYYEGSNRSEIDLMINTPIIEDVLAFRLSATHRQSGGFIDIHKIPLSITSPSQIVLTGNVLDYRQMEGDSVIRDANRRSGDAVRLAMTYTPTENLAVRSFVMHQKTYQAARQSIDYNDYTQKWVATRYQPEPGRNESTTFGLEASYDLSFGSLQYVGGHHQSKMLELGDATNLFLILMSIPGPALDRDGPGGLPPDPLPSVAPFPFGSKTTINSHELRLQDQDRSLGMNLFGSELVFDYVVGGFFMEEERDGAWQLAASNWNANLGPNTRPIRTAGGLMLGQQGGGFYRTKAAFIDATLHLTPRLYVGAGVRYSDSLRRSGLHSWGEIYQGLFGPPGDNLNVQGRPEAFGVSEATFTTPKATIGFKLDERKLFYFTASKGQRMPGSFAVPGYWDSPLLNPVCRPLAESLGVADDAEQGVRTDTVWSYDLGFKSMWRDDRLRFNVSVYHIDWTDQQRSVQLSQFDTRCTGIIDSNIGNVVIDGAEIEFSYALRNNLSVNAALGFTDARMANTPPGVRDSLGQQLEKGDAIENVAPWSGSVGLQQTFAVPVLSRFADAEFRGYVRADWRHTAERMGGNVGDKPSLRASPTRSQFIADAFSLLDLRAGLTGTNGWSASVYVANATNERAIYESILNGNQRITAVGNPRTVGFTIQREF